MANVFISHTGADIGWARKIHGWLTEDGHSVFLDVDQHDGVPVGVDWERLLFDRLHGTDAMVCVISPAYLQSVWCAAEIGAARALGTELLPVRVSAEPVDDRLLRLQQYVDAAADPTDACKRLQLRLRAIDGAGGWGWEDGKSPYPGLRPFDLGEHRVFFGRSREITQIAERLRSPDRATAAILTVLGSSGCGKSSLVRAGVLPRIAGENYWLTLPPMLPGTDPLGNLVRAMSAVIREQHIGFDATSLRRDLDHVGLKALSTDLLLAAATDDQCKLLIVIDQLEELLTQTDPKERAAFVDALAPALGGPVQVLATLRPEFLDAFATDTDLSKLALRYHAIRPLTADALRDVIEKPAKVAGLSFEDDLVVELVTDTGSGDALPLLAFTLEQLADGVRRGGKLTHQRYDEIGGVQGALQRQADAALEEACNKAGVRSAQVISALLDLATIDAEGRPTKRRAVIDELSSTMIDELEPFVDRRLLSTEAEGERTVVGVAHEAFLVNWPPLKDEIDAHAAALRARRVIESAANDWAAGARDNGALLQGRQLAKATVDIGAELEPVAKSDEDRKWRLALPKWWPGDRRLATRVDLNEVGRAFLEASMRSDRSRRRLRIIEVVGVIVVLAAAAVTAGVGFIRASDANEQAQQRLRESTALRLVSEGQAMLANIREGSDARALNQILAARKIAVKPDEGAVLTALQTTVGQLKIIDTYADVSDISISTDGQQILSADGRNLTFRDIHTGRVTATTLAYAFSRDGSRVVTSNDNRTLQVRDTQTGQPVGPAIEPNKDGGANTVMTFSPDARKVVFNQWPEFLYLWDIETGDVVPMTGLPEGGGISAIAFTLDGRRVVTSGQDGVIRVWDAQSGRQLSQPISRGTDIARAIAVSRDGRLVTGGYDNTVRVWNLDSGQPLGQPRPDPEYSGDSIASIALSRDGRRIVSGNTDNTIQLWDAETAEPIGKPIRGHRDDVNAVAFSADGLQIISGSSDKTIRIWSTQPSPTLGKPIGDLSFDGAISRDGRRIVSYGYDYPEYGTIRVWDVQALKPVYPPLVQHADAFAFSRDGSRIATLSAMTVTIWDANTGARLNEWNIGHKLEPPFGGIIFSPDGQKIATFVATVSNIGRPGQAEDAAVTIWDANSRGHMISSTDHTDIVKSAAFSPDSRQLVYSFGDNLRIMDAASGHTVKELPAPSLDYMAYRPDGKQILGVDSLSKAIYLLNAESGQPIAGMTDTRSVETATFSADGKYVIASSGPYVRIWDAETHIAVGDLTAGNDEIRSLSTTEDNRQIVANNLLLPGPAAWPDLLCAKLAQNMSDKQWNEWVETSIPYTSACPDLPKTPDQTSG